MCWLWNGRWTLIRPEEVGDTNGVIESLKQTQWLEGKMSIQSSQTGDLEHRVMRRLARCGNSGVSPTVETS